MAKPSEPDIRRRAVI